MTIKQYILVAVAVSSWGCLGDPMTLVSLDGGTSGTRDAVSGTDLDSGSIPVPDALLSDLGREVDGAIADVGADADADPGGTDLGDASDANEADFQQTRDAASDMRSMETAMFVVGNAGALSASDTIARGWIERSFVVTVVDDDALTALGASSYNIVVVSKSSDGAAIGNQLAATPTPIFLWDDTSAYSDRLGLISTTSVEALTWNVSRETVWIEAGVLGQSMQAGPVPVYSYLQPAWYVPGDTLGAGAVIIGRLDEGSNDVFAYAYPSGTMMANGLLSPARRTYVGFDAYGIDALSADGEALFEALLRWTAR